MAGKSPQYAWMNGEIIPFEDAKIHVRTQAFVKGASVFEGMRAYASHDKQQMCIFRNGEHMDRMFNCSMKILRIPARWTADDVTRALVELIRANDFHEDIHMRPTAYIGMGTEYGWDPQEVEPGFFITAVARKANPALRSGITACVSSWRRIDDESIPPRVKSDANYLNGRYVMMEAKLNGYETAFILNHQGKLAEGPGACVMLVRRGKVITPPVSAGLLESVTRATLIELFSREMGIEVVEREVDRTELYIADEVFICGTGEEVQPIISVDRHQVGTGQTGPIVKAMQELYFGVVRGRTPKYSQWLTQVY